MSTSQEVGGRLRKAPPHPSSPGLPEVCVAPETEAQCEALLRELLISQNYPMVEVNVQHLMAVDRAFADRFSYFTSRIPETAYRNLLISGCAAGSEMIVARKHGFQRIHGTEIRQRYIDICQQRLAGAEGFEVVLYDGRRLPYPDNYFSAIMSGHIIEHTPSPYAYLREHLRVLEPGGAFFLEFPHRYHYKELHLKVPSGEFLPRPLRWMVYRCLASRISPLSAQTKKHYATILRMLSPVSVWQIRLYLWWLGYPEARVAHRFSVAPGISRVLIIK
jgi:SAM-dependent methyltransferase